MVAIYLLNPVTVCSTYIIPASLGGITCQLHVVYTVGVESSDSVRWPEVLFP